MSSAGGSATGVTSNAITTRPRGTRGTKGPIGANVAASCRADETAVGAGNEPVDSLRDCGWD